MLSVSTKRFPDVVAYPERGVAWVATRHPERPVPEGGDEGVIAGFELAARLEGSRPRARATFPHTRARFRYSLPLTESSFAKNSSAVFVFVCCSPERSTPFFARNARASAATCIGSVVAHFVESSRIRDPSG